MHQYGAHLFQTSNERVWNYVNQFTEREPPFQEASLMHPNNGSFSIITGSATGGRAALTIDGAPPAIEIIKKLEVTAPVKGQGKRHRLGL